MVDINYPMVTDVKAIKAGRWIQKRRGARMRGAVTLAIYGALLFFVGEAIAVPNEQGAGGTGGAVEADAVITLQRGGCEKRCAVYKVIIFADGTVIYDGEYYVAKEGVVRDKIDPATVRELLDAFRAIDYFHLKDQYGYKDEEGCDSVLADAPVVMTSIVSGGAAKSVIHHHRCVSRVAEQLTQLEDKIDKIAKTARWIK
jgi:hypothetical protein